MKKDTITLWTLLALATPSIASALLNNFYRVIDQYAVQWLGTDSQAAIGSSTFILIATYSAFMLVSGGIGPLVARTTGANNPQERSKLIASSCKMMAIVSILTSIGLWIGASWLAQAVGLSGQAASEMTLYLQGLGLSGFFIAFGPLIDSVYISSGNSTFPMKLQLLSTVCNAFLNWLFIYKMGWGIFGAALASGVSRGLASIIGLYYMTLDFRPQWNIQFQWRRIANIGFPVSMGILTYALVYWLLLRVAISPLGPEVNAALGIGFSALEGVSWPIYSGVMMAVMSLIGRQMGAGNKEGVDKIIRLAFPTSTVIGMTMGAIFWFAAEPLCALFTKDPLTLEQAVLYARVLAFSQVFVAWEGLCEGILIGAGATRAVFWSSAPINFIRVPLGWYLGIFLGWKAFGIWWAINFTTYAKTFVKMAIVARGKWKDIEI